MTAVPAGGNAFSYRAGFRPDSEFTLLDPNDAASLGSAYTSGWLTEWAGHPIVSPDPEGSANIRVGSRLVELVPGIPPLYLFGNVALSRHLFGELGTPLTVEESLRLTQQTVTALQDMLVGLTNANGRGGHLESGLFAIARNRVPGWHGHRFYAQTGGQAGETIRLSDEPTISLCHYIAPQKGCRVEGTVDGAVVGLKRESLPGATVRDRRPLLRLTSDTRGLGLLISAGDFSLAEDGTCKAPFFRATRGVLFDEQSTLPTSWPSGVVGLYSGDTAGANEAWWVRDDGTAVDLAAAGGVADVTQVEAEAGTEANNRMWSPLRVAQAIAALAAPAGRRALASLIGGAGQGNTGTGEDTLRTFDVPAATLATDGDTVIVTAWGRIIAGKSCTVRLRVDTVLVSAGFSYAATANAVWRMVAHIVRRSSGTEASVLVTETYTEAAGTAFGAAADTATLQVTVSGDVTVALSGQNDTDATNNAVQNWGWLVEYVPAP